MSDKHHHRQVLDSPEFRALARAKDRISLVLTLLILAVYYGYIWLIAYHRGFLARKLTAHITVGIPVGIGVILCAWVLTGIYVWWANTRYDRMVRDVRKKLGA